MSSGRSAIGIFMYSNQSRVVLRYMFLMSAPAKHASLVLMTLFHRILEETMLEVRVVSSNGQSIKLPQTVMCTCWGLLFGDDGQSQCMCR
jgi:hypothetical protein